MEECVLVHKNVLLELITGIQTLQEQLNAYSYRNLVDLNFEEWGLLIVSLTPIIRLLFTSKATGLSRSSQFLFILAFICKYLVNPVKTFECSEGIAVYTNHYWAKVPVAIIIVIAFVISLRVKDYYEEEPDKKWLSIIISFALAVGFANFKIDGLPIIICKFGSYLGIIAWISQKKISRMNFIESYFTCLFVGYMFVFSLLPDIFEDILMIRKVSSIDNYRSTMDHPAILMLFSFKLLLFFLQLRDNDKCVDPIEQAEAEEKLERVIEFLFPEIIAENKELESMGTISV